MANNQKLKVRVVHTQITDFPVGIFYALKSIAHLTVDLSYNKIATLAPDSFYPNASAWDAVGTRSVIGGLDLYGNAMHCDCGMVWLGHWLRRWLRETAQMNTISKDDTRNMLLVSKHHFHNIFVCVCVYVTIILLFNKSGAFLWYRMVSYFASNAFQIK